ncbi:MAG: LOG family protein [Melioribacteraceae bacterium]|nr:LOG family protein [Melioribacteraceae bacterium]MCO6472933.1 LOG family protein [Melioribacteraceae bacterium]
MMNKTITVFGSSIPLPGDFEYQEAYKLGRILGSENINICSGGYNGIMEAVSKGAVESGAEAIGVTVDFFSSEPNRYLTKKIHTKSLFERLENLLRLGDGFVVLPGGTGTLVELALVWEHFNKGLLAQKPVAAVGEMWIDIVSKMEERITIEKRQTKLIKTFKEVESCADYIISNL